MLASIFNNGSQLWVLFIILVGWVIYWGYRTIKSHKSGYHYQDKWGQWHDVEPSLFSNQNFWFGVAGVVLMIVFMFIINHDYL